MNALTSFIPRTYGNGDGRASDTALTPFAAFHREMDQLLDGVITVTLPKKPDRLPRRIAVSNASG